jgi:starch synthase (maltosyl-transferring)
VTVWGDLAEIDNAGSADREALWSYWGDLVQDAVELGFAGFRCDAAYMVPVKLWNFLIQQARQVRRDVVFFAETLGAPESDVLALRKAGFDFFFNSSKWWNFRERWALDQHERFGRVAPSISFPETHDTTRLAGDSGGDEAVQRQRYAFAVSFSAGVMMPLGYEFGFRKQVNVVRTMPSDWERRSFDLRDFIRRLNELKIRHPALHGEGRLSTPLGIADGPLLLERRWSDSNDPAYIVVNAESAAAAALDLSSIGLERRTLRLHRVCRDDAPDAGEPLRDMLALDRAEVAFLLPDLGAATRRIEVGE